MLVQSKPAQNGLLEVSMSNQRYAIELKSSLALKPKASIIQVTVNIIQVICQQNFSVFNTKISLIQYATQLIKH